MFDFENKPVKDWTLAEAKEYCKNLTCSDTYCIGKDCILEDAESCVGIFANMELKDNMSPNFTQDEIAFCRLIKKTYYWANYIARGERGSLHIFENKPNFIEDSLCGSRKNKHGILNSNFFPQIKPLTYYSIDDIIKQGE